MIVIILFLKNELYFKWFCMHLLLIDWNAPGVEQLSSFDPGIREANETGYYGETGDVYRPLTA